MIQKDGHFLMMVKIECVLMLLLSIIKLSHSEQNVTNTSETIDGEIVSSWDSANRTTFNEENSEAGGNTTQSATSTTEEPHIAHGCDTVKPQQAGVKDCSYYCKYVPENNTWLYGFYNDGIYCWADDDHDDKDRILGLCYHGICYPLDHDNVTDLSTPEDDTFG
uniref:Basic tail secreted protein n=1 Tax=Rhipicephalus appendiculatus TaxID=34631 RepID=A0A131YWE5_RHIAP